MAYWLPLLSASIIALISSGSILKISDDYFLTTSALELKKENEAFFPKGKITKSNLMRIARFNKGKSISTALIPSGLNGPALDKINLGIAQIRFICLKKHHREKQINKKEG